MGWAILGLGMVIGERDSDGHAADALNGKTLMHWARLSQG